MKMYVMNKKYRVELKKPEFTQICALLLNKISVKVIRIALKTKQNKTKQKVLTKQLSTQLCKHISFPLVVVIFFAKKLY